MSGRLPAWVRRSCSRGRLAVLGTVLVVVAVGAVAVRTVDLSAALAQLRRADPALLGVGLAVYLLSWPLRGRRYGDVLAAMDRRYGTAFLTAAVLVSQTANLVVPARAGDGVRAYVLKTRRGVPYPTGVASLAVERVFDLLAVAALGGVAFALLAFGGRDVTLAGGSTGAAVAVTIAVSAAALSVSTVAVARSDRPIGGALRDRAAGTRLSSAADALVRFGASVRVVAANPRAIATVYAGSLAIWAADVLTAVAVLGALVGFDGASVSVPTLLVVGTLAVSVGNLAKVLPLSQGGIGLYEAAFTGIVVGVAPIAPEAALAAAVLDHALKNAVTLGGGAVAAAALNVSPRAAPEDADPAAASSDI
ncbi:lysylphosphatidylglycerol synthase transmembrane domain-containing protein [Natronomonas sp.]|uniref:lysylphosphatidylglycerol synthase transmembrane domain-containing protein n=1 Tax=Natronomonas sp. TaxID=2184060 RepID=UPI002639E5EB|nr:lysylphosphatidylglycerol synthase transmembrane domain-containing protein [Natronomonas sp.]